jgi:heat shock protein HspQ
LQQNQTFQIGDVIHHRRYGYRGVVVEVDESCQADEQWYQSNQTQPSRDQPWYHVLVDGSDHTTYVAQENLERDATGRPVEHPLLDRFFSGFFQGRHYREPLN